VRMCMFVSACVCACACVCVCERERERESQRERERKIYKPHNYTSNVRARYQNTFCTCTEHILHMYGTRSAHVRNTLCTYMCVHTLFCKIRHVFAGLFCNVDLCWSLSIHIRTHSAYMHVSYQNMFCFHTRAHIRTYSICIGT